MSSDGSIDILYDKLPDKGILVYGKYGMEDTLFVGAKLVSRLNGLSDQEILVELNKICESGIQGFGISIPREPSFADSNLEIDVNKHVVSFNLFTLFCFGEAVELKAMCEIYLMALSFLEAPEEFKMRFRNDAVTMVHEYHSTHSYPEYSVKVPFGDFVKLMFSFVKLMSGTEAPEDKGVQSDKIYALNEFTTIEDVAAEALAKHKGHLDLSGLTTLSDAAAESLGKHEGILNLSGLTTVSDFAAEALAKHKGKLDLSGLTSLSAAAAMALRSNREIEFPSKGEATKKAEEESQDEKEDAAGSALDSELLDPEQLSKISKLLVDKNPDGVALAIQLLNTLEASEEQWLELFNREQCKTLLETGDPQIWIRLVEAAIPRPRLYEALLVAAAKCSNGVERAIFVADHPDAMQFVVKILDGEVLYLDGLTMLSDAAAEALGKYKGYLYLRGLTTLSDAAAEALAKHKGGLYLSGLTTLSDATAKSLAKHEGHLDLSGLTTLSDAAAESLAKHEGELFLGDGDAADYIREVRGKLARAKKSQDAPD